MVALLVACQAPAPPAAEAPAVPVTAAPSLAAPPAAAGSQSAPAWRRIADIPTPRSEVAVAAADQEHSFFVIGGFGGPDRVESYDDATGRWARGPDLPTARHGLAVVVSPGTKSEDAARNVVITPPRLLVLTGGPTPGGSQTAVCEALDLR